MPLLSVIIVNYKSIALILDCLESIYAFPSADSMEIIVVDNLSNDCSEEVLKEKYPQVKWLQMGYNAGFARANNKGIEYAGAQRVLLLNPDTINIDDAIHKVYLKFEKSPYIACGTQLLYANGKRQISGSNFVKGGLNFLLPLPYWGSFLKLLAGFAGVKKPGVETVATQQKVDWISGAFLMIDKSKLSSKDLLDEDFFLYAEEVEWCSRLSKFGEKVLFGEFHIIHHMGVSITKATDSDDDSYDNIYDRKGCQLLVSNHLYIRKKYGTAWFLFHILNVSWSCFLFLLVDPIVQIFKLKTPFTNRKKIIGLIKNTGVLWRLVPKIIAGQPYFYKVM